MKIPDCLVPGFVPKTHLTSTCSPHNSFDDEPHNFTKLPGALGGGIRYWWRFHVPCASLWLLLRSSADGITTRTFILYESFNYERTVTVYSSLLSLLDVDVSRAVIMLSEDCPAMWKFTVVEGLSY